MKKPYVVYVQTEFVVLAENTEEALAMANEYLEPSIERYTDNPSLSNRGWGLHINELETEGQLADSNNLNVIPYSDFSKTVREILKEL